MISIVCIICNVIVIVICDCDWMCLLHRLWPMYAMRCWLCSQASLTIITIINIAIAITISIGMSVCINMICAILHILHILPVLPILHSLPTLHQAHTHTHVHIHNILLSTTTTIAITIFSLPGLAFIGGGTGQLPDTVEQMGVVCNVGILALLDQLVPE